MFLLGSNSRTYVSVKVLYACNVVLCWWECAKMFASLYQVFYVWCECGVEMSYVSCGYVVFVCVNDNVREVFCGSIYGGEGVDIEGM